jgi:hypothetical protein
LLIIVLLLALNYLETLLKTKFIREDNHDPLNKTEISHHPLWFAHAFLVTSATEFTQPDIFFCLFTRIYVLELYLPFYWYRLIEYEEVNGNYRVYIKIWNCWYILPPVCIFFSLLVLKVMLLKIILKSDLIQP